MSKVIAVASGKGGTGKTTTVAALSSCLAVLGYKTLCIDFDAGLGNLDLALGMTDFAIIDFIDVVRGDIDVITACSESPAIPDLFYLSAPISGIPENINHDMFISMFNNIRERFDFCLIDSPPGIGDGFKTAHCSADMSIIVATGELPSIRDATRTAAVARNGGITNLRLLVNRVLSKNFKRTRITVDDMIDNTGIQLLGIIPEDKYIFRALHDSVPLILYNKRKSAYDFLDAARRITGEDLPLKR